MKLIDYLGEEVRDLLAIPPFSGWEVARSTEDDLPKKEVWYEFEGHGVEVVCDGDERIRTIFLHRGDGETLSEIPFSLRRHQVAERFGFPSQKGAAVRIPEIGERGPWDRFTFKEASVHIQYRVDCDEIDMVTLMRLDSVP